MAILVGQAGVRVRASRRGRRRATHPTGLVAIHPLLPDRPDGSELRLFQPFGGGADARGGRRRRVDERRYLRGDGHADAQPHRLRRVCRLVCTLVDVYTTTFCFLLFCTAFFSLLAFCLWEYLFLFSSADVFCAPGRLSFFGKVRAKLFTSNASTYSSKKHSKNVKTGRKYTRRRGWRGLSDLIRLATAVLRYA